MKLSTALLAGVLLVVGAPTYAQSLGELAKKEQERRKTAPPAAKTYTNADLKQVPPRSGSAATDESAKPGAPAKTADAKPEPENVAATKPAEPAKDEAQWRARITGAREDLRRNQEFKEALQSRINALTADFTNRDDPYQRAKIADDRQKALAELARVSDEIDKGTKAIADIEEEARRAGVPPGWIR